MMMVSMMVMIALYRGLVTCSTPSAIPLSKAEVMLTVPRLMCSCRPQK